MPKHHALQHYSFCSSVVILQFPICGSWPWACSFLIARVCWCSAAGSSGMRLMRKKQADKSLYSLLRNFLPSLPEHAKHSYSPCGDQLSFPSLNFGLPGYIGLTCPFLGSWLASVTIHMLDLVSKLGTVGTAPTGSRELPRTVRVWFVLPLQIL